MCNNLSVLQGVIIFCEWNMLNFGHLECVVLYLCIFNLFGYTYIYLYLYQFIYLGFYIAFNTVQFISQQVVGRAEETGTYSWTRFCTVNSRPTTSNYQLSHLRPCREPNPNLRGGRRECYNSATCWLYI